MTNNKQQTEHRFCLTPELKCTMSYCDENGCINRQRHLVGDPIEMTNNKQQTALEWLIEQMPLGIRKTLSENGIDFKKAKEMEIARKEMSYSDGYAEGYKRALEMVEWYIKNYISGMAQDHIGDINKMVNNESNP
jgi:hypothetical protein